mmetsp:Transcript_18169/g.64654  ORF Transcript_18169/g.64654 Transcript_18169/m.64654 type:complete len:214 (-) Transcript_18169:14-655(-)
MRSLQTKRTQDQARRPGKAPKVAGVAGGTRVDDVSLCARDAGARAAGAEAARGGRCGRRDARGSRRRAKPVAGASPDARPQALPPLRAAHGIADAGRAGRAGAAATTRPVFDAVEYLGLAAAAADAKTLIPRRRRVRSRARARRCGEITRSAARPPFAPRGCRRFQKNALRPLSASSGPRRSESRSDESHRCPLWIRSQRAPRAATAGRLKSV